MLYQVTLVTYVHADNDEQAIEVGIDHAAQGDFDVEVQTA